MGSDLRRGAADGLVAQARIVERLGIERSRHPRSGGAILRIETGCEHVATGRAIEGAGVEMREAVMAGEAARQSPLARSCGSVDGDDDRGMANSGERHGGPSDQAG